jgi:glycosyltransferase involved in cell wall biosynthesis
MSIISIITPTFNRASFLKRMIKSVLHQEFTRWELIIIDDGSTDSTKDVVTEFNDNRIRYFYVPHQGAAKSRNFGIRKAGSDYITFLDSDDEALSGWLSNFYNVILEEKSWMISCGYIRIDSTGVRRAVMPQYFGNNSIKINFKSGTLFFDKRLLRNINGFDPSLPSGLNTDLILRSIKYINFHQVPIHFINETLLKVYEHKEKRIRNDLEAVYKGTQILLNKHHGFFQENKKLYQDYLSVAGVCLAKLGKFEKSRSYCWRAFKINPSVKSGIRVLLTSIPYLYEFFWLEKR